MINTAKILEKLFIILLLIFIAVDGTYNLFIYGVASSRNEATILSRLFVIIIHNI